MNSLGRNNITILFKKEEKQGEFPDKFEIEKDISQQKRIVTFSVRKIQIFLQQVDIFYLSFSPHIFLEC